ncbi:glycosyl hydrolase family 18 protein [Paenibacillus lutrae]|uniref:chitinase n=1 Tax=Paenibacillus lutrae TaxID=2078573 RepID=A0A7X3FHB7_9BACL|nr:glycosyl hydrolase family 18 protein [Paenibacillus lutrae]MVO99790.1 chitinase [Paenibacillus lutrae]
MRSKRVKAALVGLLAVLCTFTPLLGAGGSPVQAAAADSSQKIVGYFTSWGIYGRNYKVSDIDATKLTHLNYAFADICWGGRHGNPSQDSPNKNTWSCTDPAVPLQNKQVPNGTIVVGEPWADVNTPYGSYTYDECNTKALCGNFAAMRDLKKKNPSLKTLISVGGWTWSNRFSETAASAATRETFANSAVEFIRAYGFDGVDLDWEYPVAGGLAGNTYSPSDKQNYTLLLQKVREKLDAAGAQDGKKYLLTIASGASQKYADNTQLAEIAKVLDWINIMTYDFHGGWETETNHNAALYVDPNDPTVGDKRKYNTNDAVQIYLNEGVPANKIVLGLAFYGKGWKGCAPGPNNDGQYQKCTPGWDGSTLPTGTWDDWTSGNSGTFDYGDLAANYVGKNGYTRYWNDTTKTPYLFNPTNGVFISYDDIQSIGAKTAYIKSKGLGGAMFWETSSDCRTSPKFSCTTKLLDKVASDLLTGGPVQPDTQAPTAATNLTSPSKTANSVALSWTAATDNVAVTGYEVSYGTNKVTVTGTTANITGLQPSTAYTFAVKAKDAAGNLSAPVSVTVTTNAGGAQPDTQAPSAVTNLVSTGKTANSVALSWAAATDNVGVTGYEVAYGTNVVNAAGTSTNVTGLQPNTAYTFTVKAKDAAGNLSAPASVTVTTDTGTTNPGPGVESTFKVTSDWGTGYNYSFSIKNTGTTAITNWKLEFDYAGGDINAIWDATIVSKTNNHYVIKGTGWNSTLQPGATVTFGGGGIVKSTPTNITVTSN